MPSLVKIRVERARDLPVMDSNLQGDASTDSYVDIRLGDYQCKTATCRKTLNPVWDEEFRIEVVDDSVLQNSPVEFKIMDQDLYSSEQIGSVYVDLNPLIMRTAHGSDRDLIIQGWFPIYDILRGVHGSLKIVVKLQFIGDDNPFRESSAGVQFFSASSLCPKVFIIQEVLGFVVDLVVENDPESSWQDYFRMAKTSNDSRLKILYNLTASVRREIGKKVLEAGGNAVLGYCSHFDVEGASGIVVRAYGTACRLLKVIQNVHPSGIVLTTNTATTTSNLLPNLSLSAPPTDASSTSSSSTTTITTASTTSTTPNGTITTGNIQVGAVSSGVLTVDIELQQQQQQQQQQGQDSPQVLRRMILTESSPSSNYTANITTTTSNTGGGGIGGSQQSNNINTLSTGTSVTTGANYGYGVTPFGPFPEKPTSLQRETSLSVGYPHPHTTGFRIGAVTDFGTSTAPESNPVMLFQSDIKIFSLRIFDSHVRMRFGGLVIARSVKFLGKLEASLSDQETREGWWEELRNEIKGHARTLYCTHVVGYSETCTIFGEVCILSAVGTAAVVKQLSYPIFQSNNNSQLNLQEALSRTGNESGDVGADTATINTTSATGGGGGIALGNIASDSSGLLPPPAVSSTGASTTILPLLINATDNTLDMASSTKTTHSEVAPVAIESNTVTATRSRSSSKLSAQSQSSNLNPHLKPNPSRPFNLLPVTEAGSSSSSSNNVLPPLPPSNSGGIATGPAANSTSSSTTTTTSPYDKDRSSLNYYKQPKLTRGHTFTSTGSTTHHSSIGGGSNSGGNTAGGGGITGNTAGGSTVNTSFQGGGTAFGYSYNNPYWHRKKSRRPCSSAHVPYNHNMAPFAFMRLVPCFVCRRKWVPENMLCSVEPEEAMPIRGRGELIEARVCRVRRSATGEMDAVKVSELLPFVEFDVQRQIMLKLKIIGMNSVFGYTSKIQIGSNMVVATATATAFYLEALPAPPTLHVARTILESNSEKDARLTEMQIQIESLCKANKAAFDAQHAAKVAEEEREQKERDRELAAQRAEKMIGHFVSSTDRGDYADDDDHEEDDKERDDDDDYTSDSSSSSSTSSSTTDSSDNEVEESSSLESPSETESEEEEEGAGNGAGIVGVAPGTNTGAVSSGVTGGEEEDTAMDKLENKLSSEVTKDSEDAKSSGRHGTAATGSGKGAGRTPRKRPPRRQVYADDRPPFVLDVDDETDADIMAILMEKSLPEGISIVNIQYVKGSRDFSESPGRNVTVQSRVKLTARSQVSNPGLGLNQQLTKLFQDVYARMCFSLRNMLPCQVLGLSHTINILEEQTVEVLLTATAHRVIIKDMIFKKPLSPTSLPPPLLPLSAFHLTSSPPPPTHTSSNNNNTTSNTNREMGHSTGGVGGGTHHNYYKEKDRARHSSAALPGRNASTSTSSAVMAGGNGGVEGGSGGKVRSGSIDEYVISSPSIPSFHVNATSSNISSIYHIPHISTTGTTTPPLLLPGDGFPPTTQSMSLPHSPTAAAAATHRDVLGVQVLLTSLCTIPGTRIKRYLGPVQLHFIKESWAVRGDSHLASFYAIFISEANASARAYVAALGGNALLCHRLVPQESGGRANKNQLYNLLSVTGDAVIIEYYNNASISSYYSTTGIPKGSIDTTAFPGPGHGNNNDSKYDRWSSSMTLDTLYKSSSADSFEFGRSHSKSSPLASRTNSINE